MTVASGIKPTGNYVFLEPIEENEQPVVGQPQQDALVIAQVIAAGPEAKGAKGTVLIRASALRDALRFDNYVLVSSWDVVASLE